MRRKNPFSRQKLAQENAVTPGQRYIFDVGVVSHNGRLVANLIDAEELTSNGTYVNRCRNGFVSLLKYGLTCGMHDSEHFCTLSVLAQCDDSPTKSLIEFTQAGDRFLRSESQVVPHKDVYSFVMIAFAKWAKELKDVRGSLFCHIVLETKSSLEKKRQRFQEKLRRLNEFKHNEPRERLQPNKSGL
jgi:hypothetical protein